MTTKEAPAKKKATKKKAKKKATKKKVKQEDPGIYLDGITMERLKAAGFEVQAARLAVENSDYKWQLDEYKQQEKKIKLASRLALAMKRNDKIVVDIEEQYKIDFSGYTWNDETGLLSKP